MSDQFSRTAMLFGEENMRILKNSRVIVFGIGGVGGYCAEALARAGVGTIGLVDNDKVALSNINRQIIATHSTVGRYKTDVMRERITEINPQAQVIIQRLFYLPETSGEINLTDYDYIADAIDTVSAKLELAIRANACSVPVISSMGTGNKLDPTAFTVADIYKTSVCPLARVMRQELKKRGIPSLKVVYSTEPPLTPEMHGAEDTGKRHIPASNSFVPPVAGFIMAGEIIKSLIKK